MVLNYILNSNFILTVLECLVYLTIIIFGARRFKDIRSPAFWLVIYVAVAVSFYLLQQVTSLGFFQESPIGVRSEMEEYVSLLMAVLLYQNLQVFLGNEFRLRIFWGGLVICTVLILVNDILLIFLAGLVYFALTLVLLIRALIKTRQHLHRNRLFYWIPVLLFSSINQLSIFYQQGLYANELRFGGAVILAYIVLRYHTPDVRDFFRQFSIYLISTLMSLAIYFIGFALVDRVEGAHPGYDPLLAGAGLAVIILLLFTPLSGFVRGMINRLYKLQIYDPSLALREYSASISNILELNKLADVSIRSIKKALEVDKGFLCLVDPELADGNRKVFRLSRARRVEVTQDLAGVLAEDSPITRFFIGNRTALLQYDIDFSPGFMDAPLAERQWLSSLVMEVYIPIFGKGEWIGLFALGPKSGNRYTDEDLNMLATIASQTGVALENARLVENLKNLNEQVREAYASLDQANHILGNLEITKSNFISIASHELRTPLTVARGYTEMLLEATNLPEDLREQVMGIHKSILRQHEIMDSMFDIAQLDTRSLDMQPQNVYIAEIIRAEAQRMEAAASERSQGITIDLPALPSIQADPDSLSKMFHHLLANAIKFTPNNGQITVAGRHIPANSRDLPDGGVEIVISDTGVGVDSEFQEIIFTKFYQPGDLLNKHSTGKTKFKGSGVGLGLALSRGIVEAHGGRIWVESPGYDDQNFPGSDFHVVLPLRAQGESATVPIGSAVKLKL